MTKITQKNKFYSFASVFRNLWIILLVIVFQFVIIELIMFFLLDNAVYERIAIYGTILSSGFGIYSSVASGSYIRSGGDDRYCKKAMDNLRVSIIIYLSVLLFLVVITLF